MGVASPFQSSKPLEYWLDGLKTAELVHLWEFLSGNPQNYDELDREVFKGTMQPSGEEVRESLYSESLPSKLLCLKTQRRRKCSERPVAAVALRL